jgi:ribosomal protein L16/L10AE
MRARRAAVVRSENQLMSCSQRSMKRAIAETAITHAAIKLGIEAYDRSPRADDPADRGIPRQWPSGCV